MPKKWALSGVSISSLDTGGCVSDLGETYVVSVPPATRLADSSWRRSLESSASGRLLLRIEWKMVLCPESSYDVSFSARIASTCSPAICRMLRLVYISCAIGRIFLRSGMAHNTLIECCSKRS